MSESVAVIGFAQAPNRPSAGTTSGVETLVPVFREALDAASLDRREVDFWCSGSSDYLAGRAFSFVNAVDAIGACPPICESHVEMDAAWAFYEAYVPAMRATLLLPVIVLAIAAAFAFLARPVEDEQEPAEAPAVAQAPM